MVQNDQTRFNHNYDTSKMNLSGEIVPIQKPLRLRMSWTPQNRPQNFLYIIRVMKTVVDCQT